MLYYISGNYFNQEAFGQQTNLPWGIPISEQRQAEVAGQDFGPNARFHPTFAYEMIWDLLNFGLLMWLGRQKRIRLRDGDVFWVYMIFYSIGRFLIEGIRIDSAKVNGIPAPQIVAILSILLGWGLIIWRHRPDSKAPLSNVNLPAGARLRRITPRPSVSSAQVSQPSRVRRVPVPDLATQSAATRVETRPASVGPEPSAESSQAG